MAQTDSVEESLRNSYRQTVELVAKEARDTEFVQAKAAAVAIDTLMDLIEEEASTVEVCQATQH